MVGLICKVLIDLVRTAGGDEAVAKVMQRANVTTGSEFKLSAVYDDAQWQRLLGAACETLAVTPEQAEEAYADFFVKDALARWGTWFHMSRNSREFLMRQPAIHNSLAAGVSEEAQRTAIADKFHIEPTDSGIVTHYRSANGHCGLYKALARRIIAHYGDEAVIEELKCQKQGAEECEIHVRWTRMKAAA
jgi:hypothetical protein